ncbi:hypothetical protein ACTZWW_03145 [Salinarimonas sp. NSM]|uniref:hypothetical protein n=1 Tax=Salinarimonas sp. NSM TaxID=3458003 RepID=UPI004036ADFF
MTKDLAERIAQATAVALAAVEIAALAESIRVEAEDLAKQAAQDRRLAADEREEHAFRARARERADILAWRARMLTDAIPTLRVAYDAARDATTPAALAA